jgi:hypothetical protein
VNASANISHEDQLPRMTFVPTPSGHWVAAYTNQGEVFAPDDLLGHDRGAGLAPALEPRGGRGC